MTQTKFSHIFIILCLGYLIDYYDLSLFAVSRLEILKDLHVPSHQIMSISKQMFNAQALGVFVGGILCGVWGDKIGRVFAVRIGIFIYSSAIVASIFISSVGLFTFFRFLAGVGLAGELAVSVTLLGEIGEQEDRGVVSSSVYFFGILGGILTTFIQSFFNWKILFLIGGIAGFVLLIIRKSLVDSSIFLKIKQKKSVPKGNIKLLFGNRRTVFKIFIATMGLLPFTLTVFFINFAPEFASGIGIIEKINLPKCLFLFYIGSLLGAFIFALLDKIYKSHKKSILTGFILMFITISLLGLSRYSPIFIFSYLYILLGFSTGYFGIYISFISGHFGTNQRSTGTTLVSNLGRSSFILINFFVPFMIQITDNFLIGSIISALIILILSIVCLNFMEETYGKNLDFLEGKK